MKRAQGFAWSVIALSGGLMFLGLQTLEEPFPDISTIIFWVALLMGAELLPVSLGYQSQVTMAFPLALAIAILFEPGVAMAIAGLGAFDIREFRLEIPIWHALFNRGQLALATGLAAWVVIDHGEEAFSFPAGPFLICLAATVFVLVNLGLVGLGLHFLQRCPSQDGLWEPRAITRSGLLVLSGVVGGTGRGNGGGLRRGRRLRGGLPDTTAVCSAKSFGGPSPTRVVRTRPSTASISFEGYGAGIQGTRGRAKANRRRDPRWEPSNACRGLIQRRQRRSVPRGR